MPNSHYIRLNRSRKDPKSRNLQPLEPRHREIQQQIHPPVSTYLFEIGLREERLRKSGNSKRRPESLHQFSVPAKLFRPWQSTERYSGFEKALSNPILSKSIEWVLAPRLWPTQRHR